jgi:hypothetical protein
MRFIELCQYLEMSLLKRFVSDFDILHLDLDLRVFIAKLLVFIC